MKIVIRKISILLLVVIISSCNQEKKIEDEIEKCFITSLPDNGKKLEKHIREFENQLLEKNILNDLSSQQYYQLLKKCLSPTFNSNGINYFLTDSLNQSYPDIMSQINKCYNTAKRDEKYKKSISYKIEDAVNTINRSNLDSDDISNILLSVYTERYFDLKFHRLKLLLFINNTGINNFKNKIKDTNYLNSFVITLNSENKLINNGVIISEKQLKKSIIDYYNNNKKNSKIIILSDKESLYGKYINIVSIIQVTVHRLRDKFSKQKFNKKYDALDESKKDVVNRIIPLNIINESL